MAFSLPDRVGNCTDLKSAKTLELNHNDRPSLHDRKGRSPLNRSNASPVKVLAVSLFNSCRFSSCTHCPSIASLTSEAMIDLGTSTACSAVRCTIPGGKWLAMLPTPWGREIPKESTPFCLPAPIHLIELLFFALLEIGCTGRSGLKGGATL